MTSPHSLASITRAVVFVLSGIVAAAAPAAAGQAPAAPGAATLDLTMERAVEMALEANLGLRGGRMNLESADHAVAAARAAFLPTLSSTLTQSSNRSVPFDFTQGSTDITNRGLSFNTIFRHELPGFGTTYNVSWTNNRSMQLGGIPTFSPGLRSTFSITATQPLWRGLRTNANRTNLATTQRQRAVADLQFDQQAIRLQAAVRFAYLDLISAREGLRVAQQNLAIRQRSLEDARARVAVGASAPIDLISAEAEVASNQETVLISEAQIAAREDALRTLILDPARADYWRVRINAVDAVQSEPREIDLEAAIQNALANRLDLIALRQQIAISDLGLRAARDATRPDVNLQMNYGTTGTGGTRIFYGQGFPPPVEGSVSRSYGSVLADTFSAAYPQWSLGLNVSYPLGRTVAEANYARQQVGQRQAQLDVQALEITIVQQIRDAARQVQNSYQRVLVTRAALAANEQQLEAEQRRFAAGLSTALELQVRQGQLASARTLELNAVILYNRALIDFERVQKTQ